MYTTSTASGQHHRLPNIQDGEGDNNVAISPNIVVIPNSKQAYRPSHHTSA